MDWWRQWADLNLMKDLPILMRFNALWIVFMIFNDGSEMSHIDRKRDYESFSRPKWNPGDLDFLSRIIITYKFFKLEIRGRFTNRRIGPFFREVIGIQGPPIWSDFLEGNAGTHERSNRSEFKCRDPCTVGLVRISRGDSETRERPNRSVFREVTGIHGPPIWSDF